MEILLFVVELIEYDFEVRPGGIFCFEEVEHVFDEELIPFYCKLLIYWLYLLQNENAFLCSLHFEV